MGNLFETLVPHGIGEALQAALAEFIENRGRIDQFVADSLDMLVRFASCLGSRSNRRRS